MASACSLVSGSAQTTLGSRRNGAAAAADRPRATRTTATGVAVPAAPTLTSVPPTALATWVALDGPALVPSIPTVTRSETCPGDRGGAGTSAATGATARAAISPNTMA